MIRPIILSLSLASLMNCQTQKTTETASASSSSTTTNTENTDMQKVTLKEGEYTKIKGTDMNVKYIGIIEDSRCPPDVTCVWAGVAIVELEVTSTTSRPNIIQLASMDVAGKDAQKTANLFDYSFTLDEVPRNNKNGSTKNSIVVSIKKNN